MNNYDLSQNTVQKNSLWGALKKFSPVLKEEQGQITLASIAAIITSGLNLLGPVLIAYAIDHFIQSGDFHGVLVYGAIILGIYVGAVITGYFQTLLMGNVGQNVLFSLRNTIFKKLNELPVGFFNQNKAGDLISRINNDTDKLNQFFSQALVRFMTNILTIVGAGIFMLVINWKVGLVALAPAFLLLIFTQMISPWIKRKNAVSMENVGGLSAEISESIDNFKVIIAFNRRDYFRKKFSKINEINYHSAIGAGIANNTLTPAYGLVSNLAQLGVLIFGMILISRGQFTLGLLISFLSYISRLYDPLRQMAAVWSTFQMAFASWDRIHAILMLKSDLKAIPSSETGSQKYRLEFKDVSFSYKPDQEVLHHITLRLEPGKTYALVGPTGGGKTTTASLMARLYDPTEGVILLDGQDLRSLDEKSRAQKIGFILQEPFLFTGSLAENLVYGNPKYAGWNHEALGKTIQEQGLGTLLLRFEEGLQTQVSATGSQISLGQKQLIAFIRAFLREPELIILDEATANIDTVTEKLLDDILKKLPKKTTLVIIAHRLNTIENADEIFFVNAGQVTPAGSMERALEMLLQNERKS